MTVSIARDHHTTNTFDASIATDPCESVAILIDELTVATKSDR